MSGPIVRTGTTPAFWEGWDKVFGNKKAGATAAKSATAAKGAKKAAPKKAAAKSAKKKKSS